MKFIYAFTALAATFALATPNPAPEALTLEKKACIPDSCSDWGVSKVPLYIQ